MKKCILALFTLFLFLTIIPIWSSAHSGRTDSNGGHYDHSTGEYHYHHGHPAHQHTGGRCPYSQGSSSSSNSSYTPSSSDDDDIDWLAIGIGAALVAVLCAGVVFANQEIFDKLNATVAKVLICGWIIVAVLTIACFIIAPLAMTLILIAEIFISYYINNVIKDKLQEKTDNDDEDIE